MKKTSIIFLTIVASLSVSLGSAQAQNNSLSTTYTPEYLFESESKRDTIKYDTLKRPQPNIPLNPDYYMYYNPEPLAYNYYFRLGFFDNMYRFWFPRSYYEAIHRPGFVPRHVRSGSIGRPGYSTPNGGPVSNKRGGFGRSGRSAAQSN